MNYPEDKTILGIGSPLVDTLAHVSEGFVDKINGAKGGMALVDFDEQNALIQSIEAGLARSAGGSAANTIIGLLNLGIDGGFLGKVGEGDDGDFFISQFRNLGGRTSQFKFCRQLPTGQCLSLITPDSERTMRTFLGASGMLCEEDIFPTDFRNYHHVHLEGYLLFNQNLTLHVLKLAKAAGCTISLDLSSFEVVNGNIDILPDLLKENVDMVFANEDEAQAFCGKKDPEEALQALGKCCPLVAVKIGAEGVHVKKNEETAFAAGIKADAVDSTGAGDLWASGFLYGMLNNWDLQESPQLGNRLGAYAVQVVGAALALETWEIVNGLYKRSSTA